MASAVLARRALLAVVLLVGFYLLALGVAAALLGVIYVEWRVLHRLHAQITLFCLITSGIILWSIIPRRQRFIPPGPPLSRAAQPRLFDEIERVAQAAAQAMPVEVYLTPDVNAFVSQRGGWMGLGGRRVMGIGLGLLNVLTVSQLRSVLAHEFGHYHHGDTRLGPWVWRTRQTIERTIIALGRHWIQKPFRWYWDMFMRQTQSVSRAQEYTADALAARVAGKSAYVTALDRIHRVGPAFDAFWSSEYAPALRMGFRPAMLDGFNRFLQAARIEKSLAQMHDEEMRRAADPYNSHPSLPERLRALERLPDNDGLPDDPRPALALLDDTPSLEQALLTAMAGEEAVASLTPIEWEAMDGAVFMPMWQDTARHYAPALVGVTLAGLPAFLRSPGPLVKALQQAKTAPSTAAEMGSAVISILGMALITALTPLGWTLSAPIGEDVTLSWGEDTIEPFSLLPKLAREPDEEQAWLALCARLGLLQFDLGHAILQAAT